MESLCQDDATFSAIKSTAPCEASRHYNDILTLDIFQTSIFKEKLKILSKIKVKIALDQLLKYP